MGTLAPAPLLILKPERVDVFIDAKLSCARGEDMYGGIVIESKSARK